MILAKLVCMLLSALISRNFTVFAAAIGVDYTISPLQVTFPATQSPMSTSMSENIIVTAVTDNLFEDHERFEVVVIDISSAYVSCDGEGECAAYQVTINQNPSDSKLFIL